MNPFYSTSGSSPPEARCDNPAGHDLRLEKQESPSPLPEELVDALAPLLAEALVNDIRQYPDFRVLTSDGSPWLLSSPGSPQVIAIPQPELGGQPMRRETPAFTELRNLARPMRLRVITDAEGYAAIPGRYGRVEWFNGRDLAVLGPSTTRRQDLWRSLASAAHLLRVLCPPTERLPGRRNHAGA